MEIQKEMKLNIKAIIDQNKKIDFEMLI